VRYPYLRFLVPLFAALFIIVPIGGCALAPGASEDLAVEVPAPEESLEEAVVDYEAMQREEAGEYATIPQTERMIIKRSYLEIEVGAGEFQERLFMLSSLAENNGGFVSHSESYSDPEGNISSGRITLRVPAERFDFIINQVKEFGTVMHVSISGQDVTEEYVDLESRLRNLNAQEEVLLELMEQARTVTESVEVQRELIGVQEDIEVLRGRLNFLDDRISFSTIDVFLREPPTIRETPGWGFLDALRNGARGAVRVFNGIVSGLIIISPVLVLIAVIILVIWAILRKKNRRRKGGK